jgi:penicillin amidase
LVTKAVAVLLVIVAVLSFAAYRFARRSLPETSGTVGAPGISAPVDIIRDADGIPHIFGATTLDVMYGLGYVHAQDRLWQMEFQRRIGHGRLSEIFGAATVRQDRFLRTVGFGRVARSAWEHLPEDARKKIDAYIAGVNAFLDGRHGLALPPEFTLLGFEPEPWTGPDVLVWSKMMAWDLSANYAFELLRHDLSARVGSDRMNDLLPPYPADGLSILGGSAPTEETNSDAGVAPRGRPASRAGPSTLREPQGRPEPRRGTTELTPAGRYSAPGWSVSFASALAGGNPFVRELLQGGATTEGVGSNNWVVGGSRTASGQPLLANDPHLGANVPSLWYLAHMSAGDFDVIGGTLPGTPAVAIGRNRHIAWGETNMFADVQDLYRERLDASGSNAEFRGTLEPLRTIKEIITVSGGEPIELTVRVSRHGPLVSDAINVNNAESNVDPKPAPLEPLAFRWTALDEEDATVAAFLRLNEARNWTEFTAALREFVVPSQNFVYADVEGHIGYYAPGRVPIRANGDGSAPAEGWTGEMEWSGWIPFEDLPHVYDPPSHVIVTANHRPVPREYPHFLAGEYHHPFRAQRITDLLQHKDRLTPEDFREIQADTISLHAQSLVPLLLRRAHPEDTTDRIASDLLRRWNFDARADRAEPAIFQAWFLELARSLIRDELGPALELNYARRFSFVHRFLVNTLNAGESPWCDDVTTGKRETCDEAVTLALHTAVGTLQRELGADPRQWRWDGVHRAIFPHQGLDEVAVLRPLLSRSVPNGGDWSTVNVGAVAVERPFEQHEVSGYRQIVDLSPANESRFLDAVGMSGHFLSPHYDSFLSDWRRVRHRPMRMERAKVEQGAIGHLRLTPR